MKGFALLLALALPAFGAYTEFYVQPTGNNLNGGHTPEDTATFSAAGGTWVSATCVFTKAGLDPVAGGVTNGAWAAVYTDGTTTNATYGARVVAVDDTADTITLSLFSKWGTALPDDAVGATSIKVGGAWKGLSATGATSTDNTFPFWALNLTMTNTAGNTPSINVKGGTIYTGTNAIPAGVAGTYLIQGYTTTPRDGGKAVFDFGGAASYTMINLAGSADMADIAVTNNFSSGTSFGIVATGGENTLRRVVVCRSRQAGFNMGSGTLIECEAFQCNGSASAGVAAFTDGGNLTLLRCFSHDNAGSTTDGFSIGNGSIAMNCISANNGRHGFRIDSTTVSGIYHCDAYGNGGDGLNFGFGQAQSVQIQNCNFFKNGVSGINNTASSTVARQGTIWNCAFGSGTQTNASGGINANISTARQIAMDIQNSITYTADQTPWIDPTNYNFRIKSTATTRWMGAGNFTQITNLNTSVTTRGFPDIGAAPSTNTATGGGEHSFIWAQ